VKNERHCRSGVVQGALPSRLMATGAIPLWSFRTSRTSVFGEQIGRSHQGDPCPITQQPFRQGTGHIDRQPLEWDALRYIICPAIKAVKHHPAVSRRNAPTVWGHLAPRMTPAAICLKLRILTAVRNDEARGAAWQQFDLERALWTVTDLRTKTGKELLVPLPRQAVDLLEIIPRTRSTLLFPGRTGKPLTGMGRLKKQRRLDKVANVHGWRSSFRDWGSEADHVTGARQPPHTGSLSELPCNIDGRHITGMFRA
jgi:integrase